MALNWLGKTMYSVVQTQARVFAERVAVVIADDDAERIRAVTFGELHEGVVRTARQLAAIGVAEGTHVGLWADNSLRWLESWFAASLLGAVTVALNPRLTPREVGGLIQATDVRVLLVGGAVTSAAVTLLEDGGAPDTVHTIDGGGDLPRLDQCDGPYRAAPIDGRRVGLIQFTSGSTGMPKGVQLYEGSVATLGACCASRWLLHPADRIFGVFSLSHNAGTTFTTLAAFTAGAALVLPASGWSGGRGAEVARRTGTTVLPGLDTIVADLVASGVRWADLRLLVGGYDSETVRRLVNEFGVEVANTYGLTEVTANIATGDLRDPQELRIERIGRPHPGNEVRIVGSDGDPLACGDQGEIEARGWARMKAYYGVPEADQPWHDGWVRTGDVGAVDQSGYLTFCGRTKDVIRSGGENVAAFEIERYLESHPDVLQAAVVAAPHVRFGEVPFAFVRLREGAALTADGVQEFCHGRLAAFKVPRHVEIVQSFPLVGINKVSKPALRDRAAALATPEEAGDPPRG